MSKNAIVQYWWMMGVLACAAAAATFWGLVGQPTVYEARIEIIPVAAAWENNRGEVVAPIMSNLAKSARSIKIELVEAIYWELYSRVLIDALIEELGLRHHYNTRTMEETRAALEGSRSIQLTDQRTLQVSIFDQDPTVAVAIANAHAAQLDRLDRAQQAAVIAHHKRFALKQAERATARLAQAEDAWQSVRLLASLAQPLSIDGADKGERVGKGKKDDTGDSTESNSPVQRNEMLKRQVMEMEVELAALRRYATVNHPDVLRLEARLRALRHVLVQSEEGAASGGRTGIFPALDQLPMLILADRRLAREAKQSASLYAHWRIRLEGIQIEESLDLPRIWILDQAIPEERPRRIWQTVLVAGYLAMLFGVLLAFWFTYLDRLGSPSLSSTV